MPCENEAISFVGSLCFIAFSFSGAKKKPSGTSDDAPEGLSQPDETRPALGRVVILLI
jgi:hypothetical protein